MVPFLVSHHMAWNIARLVNAGCEVWKDDIVKPLYDTVLHLMGTLSVLGIDPFGQPRRQSFCLTLQAWPKPCELHCVHRVTYWHCRDLYILDDMM